MKHNIDATRKRLEAQSSVDMLDIDYDTGSEDVVFRAMCDDLSDDLERVIDDLPVGIKTVQPTGFGLEVVLR